MKLLSTNEGEVVGKDSPNSLLVSRRNNATLSISVWIILKKGKVNLVYGLDMPK